MPGSNTNACSLNFAAWHRVRRWPGVRAEVAHRPVCENVRVLGARMRRGSTLSRASTHSGAAGAENSDPILK